MPITSLACCAIHAGEADGRVTFLHGGGIGRLRRPYAIHPVSIAHERPFTPLKNGNENARSKLAKIQSPML